MDGRRMPRRDVLQQFGMGFGGIALAQMLNSKANGNESVATTATPSPTAKAKRVIILFQSGGPSQMDLFDHKPLLTKMHSSQKFGSHKKTLLMSLFLSGLAHKRQTRL